MNILKKILLAAVGTALIATPALAQTKGLDNAKKLAPYYEGLIGVF